ncbi:hypothetical protein Mal15_45180 [Stieleria maiorica]|uniref:Polysaccharide lyase-like protein n=1 Tax=Stieleria maiorica TaxID=2795974 RepID=A0A5B9MNK6_9BACT|nr:hypothetical protein [Stieleria maiorica]QEG00448.1 hypothetical protein Mal15_45180 [Stieleria maiorica]
MFILRSQVPIIAITALLALCTFRSSACAQSVAPPPSRPDGLPAQAKWMPGLSGDDLNVYRDQQTLWLHPTQTSLQARRANLPRLCAPIRSLGWNRGQETELVFVPEPDHWRFTWKAAVASEAMIKMVFDGDPVLPEKVSPTGPAGDASVMLHAHHASTFGEKLRYEPQWYKNTVGYWTIPADYATWDFKLDEPGRYSIAVLQGCGEGQGGSDALISIRDGTSTVAELSFQTIDTGHFQNFRWNHLGDVTVANEGTYQLRIDAKRIAKGALFDVRAIHLVKQAK